jgi:choline-phosphate cytidylyltransferase
MTKYVYIDGVWDLFHSGHVNQLKYLKQLNDSKNILIVGIINDKDAEKYKRKPIYNEKCRKIILESIKYVDKVIENAPLIITKDFIEKNKIDFVCHGFSNKDDMKKQEKFFKEAIELNKFLEVPYNYGISTTEIINKIKND